MLSKFDLRSGDWQVELEEDEKFKLFFSVGPLGRSVNVIICPCMPATLQRLMDECLRDVNLKRVCSVYR